MPDRVTLKAVNGAPARLGLTTRLATAWLDRTVQVATVARLR